MSAPKGYSSQEKEDRLSAQFQTIEPIREKQFGSSVVAHQFVTEVATDAAEAGSTASVIIASAHDALKGDVILLTSGALSGREAKVWSVATNSITLAETLPSAIATGVTFKILRHKYPSVDASGAVNVNAVIVEEALAADGGALPAQLKVMGGYDGAAVQVIKTDAAGELQVDVLSSALPSGAATSAAQTDGSQKTQIVDGSGNVIGSTGNALDVNLKTPITVDVSLSQANDSVAVFGSDGAVNRALKTDANGELQIDVLSSALPTNAATEATLATLGTEITLSAIKTAVEIIDNAISGSEMQVDVVTSALPSGASTSAAQTDGSQKSQIVDAAGDVADVVLLSTNLQGTDKGIVTNTVIHGETTAGGGAFVDVKVTPSGAMTTDTTLSSIDAAVLGQEAMANSLPVVIASDQSAIKVTDGAGGAVATESTLAAIKTAVELLDDAVSGSEFQVDVVSSALPTDAATETKQDAGNAILTTIDADTGLLAGCVSGTEVQVDIVAALPSGTNTIGKIDVNTLSVVDLLDAGILDTSSTNIAGSASNPTQVVATLAAAVKKIQLLDTTGAFIGVYTGAALSEVLQFVMGPGSDQTIEHSIPAGTRVSLKRLDSTTAVSSGIVAINFIG